MHRPCSSTRTCEKLRADRVQTEREARVVRLLQHDAIARVDQQARREIDRLLRAVHDHDLLGRAGDAARAGQVARERFAQLRGSAGRLIGEPPGREPSRAAAQDARPGLHRKIGVGGLAVAEVEGQRLLPRAPRRAPGRHREREPPTQRREGRLAAPHPRSRAGRADDSAAAGREHRGDEGSRARAAGRISLGHQLLAGLEHRVARNAQLSGRAGGCPADVLRRRADPSGSRRAAPGRAGGAGRPRRRAGATASAVLVPEIRENVDLLWNQIRRDTPGMTDSAPRPLAPRRCALPRRGAADGQSRPPAAGRRGISSSRTPASAARPRTARGRAACARGAITRCSRSRIRTAKRARRWSRSSRRNSARPRSASPCSTSSSGSRGPPERIAAIGPLARAVSALLPRDAARQLDHRERRNPRRPSPAAGWCTRLLERALEIGRSRGHRRAQISCLIGNLPAQRAYEKAGFAVVEERRDAEFERLLGAPGFSRMTQAL